jgi:hypothetical protein
MDDWDLECMGMRMQEVLMIDWYIDGSRTDGMGIGPGARYQVWGFHDGFSDFRIWFDLSCFVEPT